MRRRPARSPWPRAAAALLAVVVVAGVAAALFQVLSPHPSGSPTATAPAPGAPLTGEDRGRTLARQHCQRCHQFPEPDLLDRASWAEGVLPKMSWWLGITPPRLTNHPGAEVVLAAGLFPTNPMLPAQDWLAISNYYMAAAPAEPLPPPGQPQPAAGLPHFLVRRPGYRREVPMTSLLHIDPANRTLYVGDGHAPALDIVDRAGAVQRSIPVPSPPVSLTLKPDGFYLTLIGFIYPSDEPLGRLLFFHREGSELRPSQLADRLPRPTDALFADINGDGREDFVLSCFGNMLGILSWFENEGEDRYTERLLHPRPGAVRTVACDLNGDGRTDLVSLFAQAEEGIFVFWNKGGGRFAPEPLLRFPPVWGGASLELVDFNQDGHLDLLVANGDTGDYPSRLKRYHGVRLYLNDGQNHFHEAFFYHLMGAYKAVAADFDGDGDLDIAAISFFPDYARSPDAGFVYLQNQGQLRFAPFSFPESVLGRWLTMEVGDLDGDSDPDIVLGSFIRGPSTIPVPPAIKQSWETNGLPLLILENTTR